VPNELIKKGAHLITNSKDIIEFYKDKNIELKKVEKNREYSNKILQLLSKESLTKEQIAHKLDKNIAQINQELTILELKGYIKENMKKEYNIIE
jgi:predicted Rossmann fold nucleotide-binding protein DprA/Smf involved in DNA uptake